MRTRIAFSSFPRLPCPNSQYWREDTQCGISQLLKLNELWSAVIRGCFLRARCWNGMESNLNEISSLLSSSCHLSPKFRFRFLLTPQLCGTPRLRVSFCCAPAKVLSSMLWQLCALQRHFVNFSTGSTRPPSPTHASHSQTHPPSAPGKQTQKGM